LSSIIPYSRQLVDDDDIRNVVEALGADLITQGPKVREFEEALARYCGTRYAVVFSSGTAALHSAYSAAGVQGGDEILTSPMTFAATANAALYLGARPVFVDVEPDTGNIDASQIERHISRKTKAIVPVHYAGHPVDLDEVRVVAKKHDLIVIEDACHALGAEYKSRRTGSLSEMTVFSFHPVKPITTGEGGAVVTNNIDFYKAMMTFRSHGIVRDDGELKGRSHGAWYYEMQGLGYNYRITDIQCALGLSQLTRLDTFVDRRREIAKRYEEAFRDNPWFDIPIVRDYASPSWHLYVLRLRDKVLKRKSEIFDRLRAKGLGVQVHYIPVYLHPYYSELGYQKGLCPESEEFYSRALSIPMYQGMTEDELRTVVNVVLEVFSNAA